MQTAEHLRELFNYNDWANRRLIVALKENASEKSQKILAHLLITEAIISGWLPSANVQ